MKRLLRETLIIVFASTLLCLVWCAVFSDARVLLKKSLHIKTSRAAPGAIERSR